MVQSFRIPMNHTFKVKERNMRTAQEWFEAYAVSHQNKTNQLIHYFCVPAIFFTLLGMLMCIPADPLEQFTGSDGLWYVNWGTVVAVPALIFYLRLGMSVFVRMLLFTAICLIGNHYLGQLVNLLWTSLGLFAVAWIGQFQGHRIEGKKPSFLDDLQFLLIGPAWVMKKLIG